MQVCHAVIVTAAGSSSRFNSALSKLGSTAPSLKKEFLKLGDKTILGYSVMPFLQVKGLVAVVITYNKASLEQTKACLEELDLPENVKLFFVEGGETRQESVFNALRFLKEQVETKALKIDLVSIHDGARPFVKKETIEACLETASRVGGAVPAVPVCDTLVKVKDGVLVARLDRTNVYGVQTPQTFRFPEIYRAHVAAREKALACASGATSKITNNGPIYTDDTQIFTDYDFQVAVVEGDPKNKKITFPKDLEESS